jgi:hypothetical protein
MTKEEMKDAKRARKAEKRRDKKQYGKGEAGKRAKMEALAKDAAKKKAERAAERAISSVESAEGASMYGKKHGSSMSGEKYDAKEAYNKNLTPKARLHYLENERHDKTSGHAIHKHMRNFGASMKDHNMGAAMNGTPPGSRMQNLAKKAMNKRPAQYTDSGQNFRDANNRFVSGLQVDEGQLSKVIRKSPERPYVVAKPGALKNQKTKEKLYLTKEKGAMKKTGKPTRKK